MNPSAMAKQARRENSGVVEDEQLIPLKQVWEVDELTVLPATLGAIEEKQPGRVSLG